MTVRGLEILQQSALTPQAKQEKAVTIIISHNGKTFMPAVQEGVTWDLARQGTPGKLTFKMLRDDILDFEEGNMVQMSYGNDNLFKGFIFSHKEDKNGVIQVTAYDQLRYLKNKDITVVVEKTAAEVIRAICDDYGLIHKKKSKDKSGKEVETEAICDTGYTIHKMRASNQTLFDTIQLALDHTILYTGDKSGNAAYKYGKMYILYDDFGVITLTEVGGLDAPILIDAETAQNFNFESSIDKDTYNAITLYKDDKDAGKHIEYSRQSDANIKRWGILRKTESINERNTTNPYDKAQTMLEVYNSAKKTLSIKGAFGDTRVRAGSRIWVKLNIKDPDVKLQREENGVEYNIEPSGVNPEDGTPIYNLPPDTEDGDSPDFSDSSVVRTYAVQMMVEQVKHKWDSGNSSYTMDLTLVGRGITK